MQVLRKISDLLVIALLRVLNLNLLPSLIQINVSDSIITIKDGSDFLKSRALGFNKDEVDPDGFEEVPALRTRIST